MTTEVGNAERTSQNADVFQSLISFGPFLLFPAEGVLDRRVPVRLSRRSIDVLRTLVEHANEVIDVNNLITTVWPDRPIKANSLRFHIQALRKALRDGSSYDRYVTRIPSRGYCFAAPLSRATLVTSMAEDARFGSNSRPAQALAANRLQRVLEFIEANLEANIKVENLAAVAALSQFHFSRAFRRATGRTPHRFVSHRRLDRAKELLLKGTMTLRDIAVACNFSSQASFTRAFSRATGLPPGEFRRRHG